MKYQKADGTVYDGPIVTLPDGRIKTGPTLTADSEKLFPMPERARDNDGGFIADDKSTPDVNEAWKGGKAPKKKGKSKNANG